MASDKPLRLWEQLSAPKPLSAVSESAIAASSVKRFGGAPTYVRKLLDSEESGVAQALLYCGNYMQRREAIVANPEYLSAMAEEVVGRQACAALLGFISISAFNRWMEANKLTQYYNEGEANSGHVYFDAAMEALAGLRKTEQDMLDAAVDATSASDLEERMKCRENFEIWRDVLSVQRTVTDTRYKALMRAAETRAPSAYSDKANTAAKPGSVSISINLAPQDGTSATMVARKATAIEGEVVTPDETATTADALFNINLGG